MKKALITGSSGAIGSAIARTLAAEGYALCLHCHQGWSRAQELAQELNEKGHEAFVRSFDLADARACQLALEPLLEAEAFDVLVHAAGVHDDAPLVGMQPDQWHHVIDVSLNGFFHVVQPLLMPMIRQRSGRIIIIASVSGVTGNRGQANYAAAKAGLIGAAKSLSLELASRNVLTNVIAPGLIASPMTEGLFDAEAIRRLVPIGRMGQPSEVADLVSFLVSDRASYLTGQVIGLNGGMI